MSNNLCPCPKCKSDKAQAVFNRKHMNNIMINISYTDYGVRCDDCGYEVSGCMTEYQAIRKWNLECKRRRAKHDQNIMQK